MSDKKTWKLDSAKEMNRKHPDTFEIPTDEEINSLAVGDHVKLLFVPNEGIKEKFGERMWVKINDIWEDNTFVGNLDNEPITISDLKHGDIIMFKSEHVAGTLKTQEEKDGVDLKNAREYELFFFIEQCGSMLWRLQHDLADGRIGETEEEVESIEKSIQQLSQQQKDAVNIVAERFGIDLIHEETTDAGGNKTSKINGDYWKWYRHWKNWLTSLTDEEWNMVNRMMQKGESIDDYLPKNSWKD